MADAMKGARDQLLFRPSLTDEPYVDVGLRHAPQAADDVLHRSRASDDAVRGHRSAGATGAEAERAREQRLHLATPRPLTMYRTRSLISSVSSRTMARTNTSLGYLRLVCGWAGSAIGGIDAPEGKGAKN